MMAVTATAQTAAPINHTRMLPRDCATPAPLPTAYALPARDGNRGDEPQLTSRRVSASNVGSISHGRPYADDQRRFEEGRRVPLDRVAVDRGQRLRLRKRAQCGGSGHPRTRISAQY